MSKKILAVLPAILFFLSSVLFFVVVKNYALGICFLCLSFANAARVVVLKKTEINTRKEKQNEEDGE